MVCRRGLRERENVNQTSHISIREVLKHLQNQQERERERVGDGTHIYSIYLLQNWPVCLGINTQPDSERERER